MIDPNSTPRSSLRSPLLQVLAIGALILVLQVPIFMISSIVWERERTRAQVVAEISAGVGGAQELAGPFLLVPYRYRTSHVEDDGEVKTIEHESFATFLPQQLDIDADLSTKTLYRGIFEAPVYNAAVGVTGTFERPDFSELGPGRGASSEVMWERAQVVFEITDVRAIQTGAELEWGGEAYPFEPGTGMQSSERAGIHARVGGFEGDALRFRIDLALNGSQALRFAPLGRQTRVQARADWPDPSFQGPWPPMSRTVENDSFEAAWEIPYLGRNYPQSWYGRDDAQTNKIVSSFFGFDLLTPTDGYRRTERSIKYEALFLGLTFLTIWLFEVLSGARIHIIQYGLIGAALCLFYLLELSLSEHLGFGTAYSLAALAVVALVACYGRSVLPKSSQAITVTATTGGLYAYLYILIQLQDYALLAGSLGLLVILATIMFATRKVNWFAPRAPQAEPQP